MKPSTRFAFVFAAALASMVSASAIAAPAKAPALQSARVLQIGDVGTPAPVAAAPNQRMSLLQATHQIIPADWAAYAQQGVDVKRVVDLQLHRGTPWTASLDALLSKQGLYSVVDWDARSVYLRNSPADAGSVNRIMNNAKANKEAARPAAYANMMPPTGGMQASPYPAPNGLAHPTPGPHGFAAPQHQMPAFAVQRTDRTLREVLQRWSAQSGWSFEASYWAAPKDLPVAGAGSFNGGFEEAVIALLHSTRLTDMPVKPCFYTNRVVRVQVATSRCDWSQQAEGEKQ